MLSGFLMKSEMKVRAIVVHRWYVNWKSGICSIPFTIKTVIKSEMVGNQL